ncbi:putative isochorismate synthase [Gordonia hirsuta DSM 44140 = NBRC 16056]|uniref:isochorismate synthase n=1 Tax=Gordonia hirsuta DSM 44140 = NBRC 16056 TaxID=1121927 RepID=L7LD06_9ACTN|nr:isochorismate synthase [Gordonia hirsuta]GAC58626.1 putative isochorismate synthase [Gordonia hirsuta DSM 44140 = NBRC 16056]
MITTPSLTGRRAIGTDAGKPSARPPFLLCRNDHRILGHGRSHTFGTAGDAADALRRETVPALVGAIPFDVRDPAALWAPDRLEVSPGPWQPAGEAALPRVRVQAHEPAPTEHRRRVAAAVTALRDLDVDLSKVVLARRLSLRADTPLCPWALGAALRAGDPAGSVYVVDLSAAGDTGTLVGASPEILVRKRGRHVSAHPLAGSAPRHPDPAEDAQRGAALARSAKDLREHAYVVTAIADALAPLCRRLQVPPEPELTTTPAMWHLGSPIHGELADPGVTALDLALAVHPTPAICGTPTLAARDHILAAEGPRGFYAGAVGWARTGPDGGSGEWLVTIRSARVDPDGLGAQTWAGGGIVADSDPDAEVAETSAKLATVLRALGLSAGAAG